MIWSFLGGRGLRVPFVRRRLAGRCKAIEAVCTVTDSLALARHKHPGQKNNLDALCRRYGVDNTARTLHGALLDAEILADVYLLMTGGQTALFAQEQDLPAAGLDTSGARRDVPRPELPGVLASPAELAAHESLLNGLDRQNGEQGSVWRRLAGVRSGT